MVLLVSLQQEEILHWSSLENSNLRGQVTAFILPWTPYLEQKYGCGENMLLKLQPVELKQPESLRKI